MSRNKNCRGALTPHVTVAACRQLARQIRNRYWHAKRLRRCRPRYRSPLCGSVPQPRPGGRITLLHGPGRARSVRFPVRRDAEAATLRRTGHGERLLVFLLLPSNQVARPPEDARLRDGYLEGRFSIRLRRRGGVRGRGGAQCSGHRRFDAYPLDTQGSAEAILRPVDRSSPHRRCTFYRDIVRDFITWRPKSSEDAVVLFHDTAVEGAAFGVKKFFAEPAVRHPSIEFYRGYGLGSAQHRTGGARAATRRIALPSPPGSGGLCFPWCRVDGAISASR
jgi:hypothetical protein